MALPPVPENLENIVVVREYLSKLKPAIEEAIAAGGGGGGGGTGDIKSDGTVPFAANESMGGFKLTSVGAPTAGGDAANKTYVDTQDTAVAAAAAAAEALDLRLDGTRPMTGALNMNTHLINGVVDPVSAQDAATKNYVDNNEKYAATFIVHPTVGRGTHTTIQAAVAAVPVGGADIYVHEGTYAPPSTIALPIDRDVKIRGAGAIGITEITIPTTGGGGPSPLFSIAGGATADYDLFGFKATGDNTFQQSLISINSAVDVWIQDVEVIDTRDIVVTTSTPTVVFDHCYITFTSFATITSFWRGVSGGKLVWNYVNASFNVQTSDGIVGSPEWNVTDSYIGGGGPLASVLTLGKTTIQGMRTDKIRMILGQPGNRIVNLQSIDGQITINNTQTSIANSIFTTPTLSGNQISFTGTSGQVAVTISGCIFDSAGATGTNFQVEVSNVQGVEITGCSFSNNGTGAGTDANIGVGDTGGTTKLTVVSCQFFGGNPVQAVKEFGGLGTITGYYDNNLGFESSSIVSTLSTVNDVRKFVATAVATVDAFTTQFTHTNSNGLLGVGSIKNTGGTNTMTVRLTGIDAFGVTDTATFDVLPGASATYSMSNAVGTALAPFVSYAVAVQSTTPGNSTTFSFRHSTGGSF